MKHCTHCGAEIAEDAVICVNCGCSTEDKPVKVKPSGVKIAARIFMILGCVFSAFLFLIPLFWTLPMTVKYWYAVEDNKPVGTAFKVCSLLFVSTIGGILMLCADD